MREVISEFIGTFMLIFFGTGAIAISAIAPGLNDLPIALTVGGTVMLAVEVFGDISGAHINPAVTVGFWMAGRFETKKVLPYFVSQTLGGTLASLILYLTLQSIHPNLGLTEPFKIDGIDNVALTFFIEYLLTLILMLVILFMATGSREKGLKAGATIGLTIFIEVLVFGPITGASMNPARSIAPAIVLGNFEHIWIYIIAPILGAVSSVPIYQHIGKRK